jgi:hypothetical protein
MRYRKDMIALKYIPKTPSLMLPVITIMSDWMESKEASNMFEDP